MKKGVYMKKILLGVILLFSTSVFAGSPIIIDPDTGQYLGNLNANRYDPNSVANPHGVYGSRHSPNSINNPTGRYGSRYSPSGANNPYGNRYMQQPFDANRYFK